MTVRLGHYFSFTYPFPSSIYCTMDTLPSLLVNALSWTHFLTPRQRQDALRTVRFSPYLLHVLSPPLLYHLCVHQYLLMCTLRALFMPTSPHRCLMYHCTLCARFLTPLTCVIPRPLYALSLLRPSTRRSRCRISISRAFGEDKGTQWSSLLSCLSRAEPRHQAWLKGFRGSQAIGLRIRGSQVKEIGREGLQTQ